MKDIQGIMMELDNLGTQIATTLEEEAAVKELASNAVVQQATPAPPAPIRVPFCCTVGIPEWLRGHVTANNFRVTYDLSCLQTKIQPCFNNGNIVFWVKVVGCIPFLINVGINTSGLCTFPNTGNPLDPSLCCNDSVCVDECILECGLDWMAYCTAGSLNFNCNTVSVEVNHHDIIENGCAFRVFGNFVLNFGQSCTNPFSPCPCP